MSKRIDELNANELNILHIVCQELDKNLILPKETGELKELIRKQIDGIKENFSTTIERLETLDNIVKNIEKGEYR